MQREQRRLAAILAADVAGFSRLMAADESRTLARFRSLRAEVFEPKIAEYGGRIVGSAGDSLLVEFPSVVDAVQCAIELQDRLKDANSDLPQAQRMMFRMGVNLGDVIAENHTIYGDGVNVAARLEKLAEPGSICIARNVHDQVRGKLACSLIDPGEQRVHNIPGPVHAYRVSPTAGVADLAKELPIGRNQDTTSIAILPFIDMSREQDQGYFADGLTEDLITELSRSRHLSVVARNTVFTFKGKAVNAHDVGRELGADFLVEGSVRIAGKRVRVTVQLIDCATGAHAWAERYDRDFDEIFALQDEIVAAVVACLAFNLEDAANIQRLRNPTKSATAYSHYLRSRAAWRIGDEVGARNRALEAVEIDPNFAKALSMLGFIYAYGNFSRSTGLDEPESDRLSRMYTERAIAADQTDTAVLTDAATVYAFLSDGDRAKLLVDAALAINPRDLDVLLIRGWVLAMSGQIAEGRELVEWCNKIEPRMPPGARAALCDVRYMARDYEGALTALAMIIDQPYYIQLYKAIALAQLGRIDEARRLVTENAPVDFAAARFARRCAAVASRTEDREHWLEGFRKAGIQV